MRPSFLLSLSLLAACGSDGNKTTGMPPGIATWADLQAAYVAASCGNNAKCGAIADSREMQCETDGLAALKRYPPPYDEGEAIAAKRLAFDSAAAQKCVDAVKAAGCTLDQYFDALASCDVTRGLVKEGGACKASSECESGWCDRGTINTDGCAGTCKPFIATGMACDPANSRCARSDYCDGATKQCTARGASGATCSPSLPCQRDLLCRGYVPKGMGTPEKKGTCGGRAKAGEPCTAGTFGNTDCELGLFCDTSVAAPVCAQRLASGAACSDDAACADGLACVGLDFDDMGNVTTKGACGAWIDLGGACDPNPWQYGCSWDAVCDRTTMICRLFGLEGADCSSNGTDGTCANHLYCDSYSLKCTAMVPYGAMCMPPQAVGMVAGDDPCHDGTCTTDTKVCAVKCM